MEVFEREIDRLREVLWSERDPQGRVFAPLADAYRQKGDLPLARTMIEEGLQRLPDFASGHVVAGWIHRDMGSSVEAEQSFLRVLELDPENTVALQAMGELATQRGSHAEAAEYFRRLITLDPGAVDPERQAAAEGLPVEEEAAAVLELEKDGSDVHAVDEEGLSDTIAAVPVSDLMPDPPTEALAGEGGVTEVVSVADLAPEGEAFDFGVADLSGDADDLVSADDAVADDVESMASEIAESRDAVAGSVEAPAELESAREENLSVPQAFHSLLSHEPTPAREDTAAEDESAVTEWSWSPAEDEVEEEASSGVDEVAVGETEPDHSVAETVSIRSLAPTEEAPTEVADPEVDGSSADESQMLAVPVRDLGPDATEAETPGLEAETGASEESSRPAPQDAAPASETGDDPVTHGAASEEATGEGEPSTDDFQAWLERNSL